MKNLVSAILFSLLALSCSSQKTTSQISQNTKQITTSDKFIVKKNVVSVSNYAATITSDDLKKLLYKLASDEFEGRKAGSEGQKKAAKFITDYYKSENISSPVGINYLQNVPTENFKGRSENDSENVLAFIKGTEKPDEIIVISAHYDHLGTKGNDVYYGADDDGSGTVAVLEIAEAFEKAVKNGNGPKRSILFINLTGEEMGLIGSKYYAANPIYPLQNTVADLNIDMIGRVDLKHKENPNYIYLIGSDKLSTELNQISEKANATYTKLDLDYTFNDENDPNRFYYRSDHYQFAKNNIPVIFYFNGVHDDYHKPTDTPDKINYDLLTQRAQLVFYTAWELANRPERIKVDVNKN